MRYVITGIRLLGEKHNYGNTYGGDIYDEFGKVVGFCTMDRRSGYISCIDENKIWN